MKVQDLEEEENDNDKKCIDSLIFLKLIIFSFSSNKRNENRIEKTKTFEEIKKKQSQSQLINII